MTQDAHQGDVTSHPAAPVALSAWQRVGVDHLRRCAACGHVGCCDTSPMQHGRPTSARRGIATCRASSPARTVLGLRQESAAKGPRLANLTSHPEDQPTPGPSARCRGTGCSASTDLRRSDRSETRPLPRAVVAGLDLVAAGVFAPGPRAVLRMVVVGPLAFVERADLQPPPDPGRAASWAASPILRRAHRELPSREPQRRAVTGPVRRDGKFAERVRKRGQRVGEPSWLASSARRSPARRRRASARSRLWPGTARHSPSCNRWRLSSDWVVSSSVPVS